ncbi:MAG: hypothetical protein ACF8R7_18355 [Phycisphaerales bacterium JB039]
MKLLASLLLTVALALGTLSAATAYTYPTSADLVGRTLKFDAARAPDGAVVAPKDTPITPEVLEALRAANVERVHVKEFGVGLWPHNWLFALALGGLFAGSMLMRAAGRKAAAAGLAPVDGRAVMSPRDLVASAKAAVESLRSELAGVADGRQRTHLIIERLDATRKAHLTPFVDSRVELVGSLGLAGYARIMDIFSAAERQVNRAWSAAADGALNESEACLERASDLLSGTISLLNELQGAAPG